MARPLKFESPEELQRLIDVYFDERKESGGPISITGLALHLGCYRETLTNYQERDVFFDTIKTAKQRVEQFYEERLPYQNATGPIFALKNFGWTDKQDVNLGGQKDNPVEANLTVTFVTPAT